MSKSTECFFCWLSSDGRTGYADLSAYAQAAKWPKVRSLVQAWTLIDKDAESTQKRKLELKRDAALAFVDFERGRLGTASFLGLNGLNAFGVGVFMFMAAILAILALAIFDPFVYGFGDSDYVDIPLLVRLANVDTARGLITFVLVLGVIALALIIVTANVTANDGEAERFERSKEILASLIAIVGTILGFYFGKGS
ncbi:MAG: hypothetical protein AAF390_08510 [Pseudomonadota bacterium]